MVSTGFGSIPFAVFFCFACMFTFSQNLGLVCHADNLPMYAVISASLVTSLLFYQKYSEGKVLHLPGQLCLLLCVCLCITFTTSADANSRFELDLQKVLKNAGYKFHQDTGELFYPQESSCLLKGQGLFSGIDQIADEDQSELEEPMDVWKLSIKIGSLLEQGFKKADAALKKATDAVDYSNQCECNEIIAQAIRNITASSGLKKLEDLISSERHDFFCTAPAYKSAKSYVHYVDSCRIYTRLWGAVEQYQKDYHKQELLKSIIPVATSFSGQFMGIPYSLLGPMGCFITTSVGLLNARSTFHFLFSKIYEIPGICKTATPSLVLGIFKKLPFEVPLLFALHFLSSFSVGESHALSLHSSRRPFLTCITYNLGYLFLLWCIFQITGLGKKIHYFPIILCAWGWTNQLVRPEIGYVLFVLKDIISPTTTADDDAVAPHGVVPCGEPLADIVEKREKETLFDQQQQTQQPDPFVLVRGEQGRARNTGVVPPAALVISTNRKPDTGTGLPVSERPPLPPASGNQGRRAVDKRKRDDDVGGGTQKRRRRKT